MILPTVSIIVPIYKVEPYLQRCLDSIVSQSYTNLEIILVDDGSPDESPQICNEYAAKDNRIKVIHKKNGGLSDARNAGIDISEGDYITFIDSDDWVHENYISTLLGLITNKNADIAIGENIRTGGNTFINKKTFRTDVYTSKEALIHLLKDNHLAFTVSWGKIYKRCLFSTLRFPIGKFHEDEFTSYILFYNSRKIAYTSEVLYFYYQRKGSIVSTRHPWDVLEYLEQRYLFFKERKETDLLPYILPPLCWQFLCAYWNEQKNKHHASSKKYLSSFKFYVKDLNEVKVPLFHKICLRTFANIPILYLLYRRMPFHIRKEF